MCAMHMQELLEARRGHGIPGAGELPGTKWMTSRVLQEQCTLPATEPSPNLCHFETA